MRESIRCLLRLRRTEAHSAPALRPLRELAGAHSARLTVDDQGKLRLDNRRHNDLGDGMFDLLLIILDAQEHGSWRRLKVCGNPECRWSSMTAHATGRATGARWLCAATAPKNRALCARRR